MHAGLAALSKCPELAIGEAESKQLAEAAGKVMRHYPIETTQKTLDWAGLGLLAGTIYGTRVVAIGMRRDKERREARATGAGSVMGNGATIFPHDAGSVVDLTGMVQRH
jgi:hypothetical protein